MISFLQGNSPVSIRRRTWEAAYPLIPFIVLLLLASACGQRREGLLVFRGLTMGTTYSVKLVAPSGGDGKVDLHHLKKQVDRILDRVNRRMSVYRADSEVSRFNRSRSPGWFAVSRETARVVAEAQSVSHRSGGALDITVAPLINTWGFGPPERTSFPSPQDVRRILERVGYRHLTVRLDPPALKKDIPDLTCDLAAVAKGHGVDQIARFLEGEGIVDYLVEIGGEVRTGGLNHLGTCWRVGVASPGKGEAVQRIIPLCGLSMATSGDYRNYFEKNGVRYSHTIDPKSGSPVTHNLASVTVVAEECMNADALATALNVLGEDAGYRLALEENLAALFIMRSGASFRERMTQPFRELLKHHD